MSEHYDIELRLRQRLLDAAASNRRLHFVSGFLHYRRM